MAIDEQKLEMIISDLGECIDALKETKEQLKVEYEEKKHQYVKNTYNSPMTFEIFELSFEEAFNKVIKYLEIQIESLENYSKLRTEIDHTIISKNYNNILNEFDYPYDTSSLKLNVTNIDTFINILTWKNLNEDYKRLDLLKQFSGIEKDIVLIGGNGKGKTFLANFLKESEFNSISVIGAQKILNFYSNSSNSLRSSQKDIEESLLKNTIKDSKDDLSNFKFFNFLNDQFTKLITAMKVEYMKYLCECDQAKRIPENNSTVFGKVRNIFPLLFKDLELSFNEREEIPLRVKKNRKEYSVNGMSEGEKVVLYYAISVLMAKDDGLIIIDEPETYLNPSISNLLWDKLKEEKPNTQFLFITHSVDFVLGRSNSQIAWIKEFIYPNEWKLELLMEENELPKQMLTEILGSSKPFLFCEGTKVSHDYQIYKALFEDKYTVIPSEGHIQVINNVKAVNKLEDLNTAHGIIDLDTLNEDEIKAYKEEQIEVLPFNEIEMLFFEEHIMETFMKNVYAVEYNSKINDFKSEFFKEVAENTEKIALAYIKKYVENYLLTEKIKEYTTFKDIQNQLENFFDFDIQDIYEQKLNQIKQIVQDKQYFELLKICNLKRQITKGLANNLLDSKYIDKVKEKIIVDKDLQAYIRNTYFSNLNY
ncbi:AAA family ATPase [uncultured Granulicatella sp.]|uniref:AAA family ATPase n=1 Tax=uncultured Granulicatella sp. TaxID=316089 RepID=UPI0028D7F849|nr:AAA family ATPase [uncultured Granulicatella sp.]